MGEALLESEVLDIAEPAIGVEGRRVIRPDVEDDMVAELEELGGHRRRRGLRVAATAVLRLRQDISDDGDPGIAPDDVGSRRGHEPNPSRYSRLSSGASDGRSGSTAPSTFGVNRSASTHIRTISGPGSRR